MDRMTEPRDKQQQVAGGAETPSSAIIDEPPPIIDRDCQKCISYLTGALDRMGSRPRYLLRALGVISHDDGEASKLYEHAEDGRGILIRLEKNKQAAVDGLVGHVQGGDSDRVSIEQKTASSDDNTKLQQSTIDGNETTLGRRLTKAATLFADGIRHSAEDILNNDGGIVPSTDGGVLTTSPAVESSQSDDRVLDIQQNSKGVTTIAVECQTCGVETRAEAGARAFVRGPVPLSIILCSNRLTSQREVEEVLVHELVHVYGKMIPSFSILDLILNSLTNILYVGDRCAFS